MDMSSLTFSWQEEQEYVYAVHISVLSADMTVDLGWRPFLSQPLLTGKLHSGRRWPHLLFACLSDLQCLKVRSGVLEHRRASLPALPSNLQGELRTTPWPLTPLSTTQPRASWLALRSPRARVTRVRNRGERGPRASLTRRSLAGHRKRSPAKHKSREI